MSASTTCVSCEHLAPIEAAARSAGIEIEQTGDWWGSGHAKNVYFRCVLDETKLRARFNLPSFVTWEAWDGRAAGHEAGFACGACHSLLVGAHPAYTAIYPVVWPT